MQDHLQGWHLWEQSKRLAGEGAGRPVQVDLRRSVSTAYYAAYHDVTLRAALEVSGHDSTMEGGVPNVAAHLVRWFSHGAVVKASELAQNLRSATTQAQWKPGRRAAWELLHDTHAAALPADLTTVAELLISLQDRRHRADYDRTSPISRREAHDAVDDAWTVLEVLKKRSGEPPFRGFFTLVALSSPRLPPGV